MVADGFTVACIRLNRTHTGRNVPLMITHIYESYNAVKMSMFLPFNKESASQLLTSLLLVFFATRSTGKKVQYQLARQGISSPNIAE